MEYGSHISMSDESHPSLIEVTAQESLGETLQPALTHLIKVLKDHCPSLGRVLSHPQEIHLLLHTLLQWHCLSAHNASFAEHFYGLQRVDLKTAQGGHSKSPPSTSGRVRPLTSLRLHKLLRLVLPLTSNKHRSLVMLVLLPYLHQKISTAYEENEHCAGDQGTLSKVKQHLLSLWPVAHLALGTVKFVCYFRYLVSLGSSPSLAHRLSGVSLVRRDEEEGYSSRRAEVSSYFLDLFMETLEMGAFFLQFLDWYYSTDRPSATVGVDNSSTIPPPPHGLLSELYGAPKDSSSCPICGQERVQPTVVTVSGVVYCYSCILVHVRSKESCPVSGYPASVNNLICIYQS